MDQHADSPKTRYISTASSVFAEKGYNAASLADIANQLDVTKQALLHFFGSKAALYEEVLKALSDRLLSSIQNVEGTSPEEHLRNFFLQLSTTSLKKPADTQLVLRALLDAQASSGNWPLKHFSMHWELWRIRRNGGHKPLTPSCSAGSISSLAQSSTSRSHKSRSKECMALRHSTYCERHTRLSFVQLSQI